MVIVIYERKPSGRSWGMEFNMEELLFPKLYEETYKDSTGRYRKRVVGERHLNSIKRILRLIQVHGDPDQWEDLRKFIQEKGIRRYKKYLAIMEELER